MSTLKDRTKVFFTDKETLAKDIGKIIDYGSGLSDEQIENWLGYYWSVNGNTLRIFEEKPPESWANDREEEDWYDNANQWEYTVSSYSAKGEKFFVGSQDGLTFVMGYPEDRMTRDAHVHVFDDEKKV